MIESNNFPHPHLDIMSNLLELPYSPSSRIRDEKNKILARLKLDKNEIHEISVFPVSSNPEDIDKIYMAIKKGISENKNVLIVGYDTSLWNSNLGAHPVATLADEEEMLKRLIVNNNKLEAIRTQRGELITFDVPTIVALYPKSRSAVFNGFEDNGGIREVRLGGGFKIQINSINFEGEELNIKLSGSFCYNDSHQRVLSLSSDDDKRTPRSEEIFEVRYKDGMLYLKGSDKMTLEEAINSGQIHNYAFKIFEQILNTDRAAVTTLFRVMLTSHPSMGMHQLEGFFNLQGDEIKINLADFDGIDNIDTVNHHLGKKLLPELNAKERLLKSQLITAGFLLSDPESLILACKQRQRVEQVRTQIENTLMLPEEVRQSLLSHLKNTGEIFKRKQTGAVKLGRLLKTLKIDFSPTDYQWLGTLTAGENKILSVDVEGYSLAYWLKDNQVVNTSSLRDLIPELSELTKTNIVGAYLSYLGEGD